MIRKLSASGFLAFMALILAFQHPVLGYCECSHDFYLTDCGCSAPAIDECSCCPSAELEKAPCQDCRQKISYDPGDILWEPAPEPATFTGAELAPLPLLDYFTTLQATAAYCVATPPRPPPDSGPLFLRLGVMLL